MGPFVKKTHLTGYIFLKYNKICYMFSGIIEEKGIVKEVSKRIWISCKKVLEGIKIGDSISVNGCCLTITSFNNTGFTSYLSKETLKRTNLGLLKIGNIVNLERPLRLSDRLGGHIVTGHIDGLAALLEKRGEIYVFLAPKYMLRYLTKKGSVAIDGVSLTIVDIMGNRFSVSIIPHTLNETTFGKMNIGWKANIEVDYLAKIQERLNEKSISNR